MIDPEKLKHIVQSTRDLYYMSTCLEYSIPKIPLLIFESVLLFEMRVSFYSKMFRPCWRVCSPVYVSNYRTILFWLLALLFDNKFSSFEETFLFAQYWNYYTLHELYGSFFSLSSPHPLHFSLFWSGMFDNIFARNLLHAYCFPFLGYAKLFWSANAISFQLFWSISVEFYSIFLHKFSLLFAPDNFHVSGWNSKDVLVFCRATIIWCSAHKFQIIMNRFLCMLQKISVNQCTSSHKHSTRNLLKCGACWKKEVTTEIA